MKHRHILITAGPTVEKIDPVRYISNYSTGKMGYALAKVCIKAGHHVHLITGPTYLKPPRGCHVVHVKTAREMFVATKEFFPKADVTFKVAAVADYHVVKTAKKKIKKTGNTLTLKLVKNPDILKELGKIKKPHQILVGFAAETHWGVAYARKKLKEKKLDWIVLNVINKKNVGFGADKNQVTLIASDGKKIKLPALNKQDVAHHILRTVLKVPVSLTDRYHFTRFRILSWLLSPYTSREKL